MREPSSGLDLAEAFSPGGVRFEELRALPRGKSLHGLDGVYGDDQYYYWSFTRMGPESYMLVAVKRRWNYLAWEIRKFKIFPNRRKLGQPQLLPTRSGVILYPDASDAIAENLRRALEIFHQKLDRGAYLRDAAGEDSGPSRPYDPDDPFGGGEGP